ncbi:MAG: hypothetical protein CVU40_14280 [Chloroflexi bacterium HGW-Chloroflexi-2]|jgi:ribosomal protein S27AE|nr:MAG: hypothetical protein CVU40_14280 [Chloroflexi bacterium HGW-Chloroflexi-2]
MRVFYHSALISKELLAGSIFSHIPCKAYLELKKEKGDNEFVVILNGKIISSDDTKVECGAEVELVIRQGSENYSYMVKPIVRALANDTALVYEQFTYEYKGKLKNEIESVKSGALKMYAIDQSTEVRDWTDTFDKMEDAFSAFKRICDKPKSHLKAINEVRPIETVKRIGYESIPYLAAHSEDWLARTASGLKPARLFSRVEDDEHQIYENRVTKTLIDQIISFLRRKEKDLKDQYEQLHGIINSSVQTGSFGFDASFQKAVSELFNSDKKTSDYRSKALELIDKLHKKSILLLRKYRSLRKTRLYSYLKKTKPVMDPINKTNILLMDKHYSVVFKLWKAVHKEITPQEITVGNQLELGVSYSDYLLFCRTLCGFTAHVLNFDIIEDGKYCRYEDNLEITIKDNKSLIRVTMRDKTRCSMELPNGVCSPIAVGNSYESFYFDGKTLFWDNDISFEDIENFCSLFKIKESRGKEHYEGKKKYTALKGAVEQRHRKFTFPSKSEFVILPAVVELENDNRNIFKSYMEECTKTLSEEDNLSYVIIALPKCEENEQKIISYAKSFSDRTLFLPLTMFDINSFRRLQNVMLRQIITLEKNTCPSCGGKMRNHGNQLICDACNQLMLTKTICPYPECKHEYHYLSYDISQDIIQKMKSVEPENFYQRDSLYQYKDIVDMSVDSGRLRTICPRCRRC